LIEKYGIRPEIITAAGKSMYFPIAPNTTEAGKARNRRIEFIISPDLSELYKIIDNNHNTK
jgi:chemotaxis protein MotB